MPQSILYAIQTSTGGAVPGLGCIAAVPLVDYKSPPECFLPQFVR